MTHKSKSVGNSTAAALKSKSILGRSALTGTRVLRPAAAKGGTVSRRQVRAALRRLMGTNLSESMSHETSVEGSCDPRRDTLNMEHGPVSYIDLRGELPEVAIEGHRPLRPRHGTARNSEYARPKRVDNRSASTLKCVPPAGDFCHRGCWSGQWRERRFCFEERATIAYLSQSVGTDGGY
jgi:hypothetical protein